MVNLIVMVLLNLERLRVKAATQRTVSGIFKEAGTVLVPRYDE